jgi:hypothetical protein
LFLSPLGAEAEKKIIKTKTKEEEEEEERQ